MKQLLVVLLLLGYFSSSAHATEHGEEKYVGVFYGQASTEDVDNGNLGLVVGGFLESGPGVEFFYSNTVDKDDFEDSTGRIFKYETQAWGLLGTYRFGGDLYAMLKAGYTFVDVKANQIGGSSNTFDEDGLSYGLGVGYRVGENGSVELNYLVLPEIEEIEGILVEADTELLSLGYNWHF